MRRWIAMMLVFALLLPGMIPAAGAEEETTATEITEETTLPAEEPAEETEAPAEEPEAPAEEPEPPVEEPTEAPAPGEAPEEDWEEIPIEGEPAALKNFGYVTIGKNYKHSSNLEGTLVIEYYLKVTQASDIQFNCNFPRTYTANLECYITNYGSNVVNALDRYLVQSVYTFDPSMYNGHRYTKVYALPAGTYTIRITWDYNSYPLQTPICDFTVNQYYHTAHIFNKTGYIQPTCTENGYWYDECGICGFMKPRKVKENSAGCDYQVTTCTDNKDGTHTANYVCSRNSTHTKTAVEEHTYTDGVCICGVTDTNAIVLGDLDRDGDADAFDLTILARHVGGIEEVTDAVALANADVTGDGRINANDLTKHARFVGGIITSWDQE